MYQYDYANQAWTLDGVYLPCNHPQAGTVLVDGDIWAGCSCFGTLHAGQYAVLTPQ